MSKATFGAEPPKINVEKLQEARKERQELGAIWEHTSRTNNPYMNIVLSLPKSDLLKLIEDSKTDENGKVRVGFVAFHNDRHSENSRSPKYRIYKDIRGTEFTQASDNSTSEES